MKLKNYGEMGAVRYLILTRRNAEIPPAKKNWNSWNVLISQADGLQIRWIISDGDKWLFADRRRLEKCVLEWHPFKQIKSSGWEPSDCCLMSDWWGNCGHSNVHVRLCMMCVTYLFMIEGGVSNVINCSARRICFYPVSLCGSLHELLLYLHINASHLV